MCSRRRRPIASSAVFMCQSASQGVWQTSCQHPKCVVFCVSFRLIDVSLARRGSIAIGGEPQHKPHKTNPNPSRRCVSGKTSVTVGLVTQWTGCCVCSIPRSQQQQPPCSATPVLHSQAGTIRSVNTYVKIAGIATSTNCSPS